MRTRAERLELLSASRIYVIAPTQLRAGLLADLIPTLASAGAGIIQLRDRTVTAAQLEDSVRACARAAQTAGVLFVVNDDPQLAALVGADGVHLGQDDGSIAGARDLLGPDAIVGRTTRGGSQLAAATAEGADYASVSPIWATPTKPGREPVGLSAAAEAARVATLPWFALGGLDRRHAQRVVAVGATRLAAVREIADSIDPAAAIRGLTETLDTAPRVLSVAGSDSGGGAGVQADIKAIVASGGFPMTAITAVTAQSTIGVSAVHSVPPAVVAEQMRVVIDDLGIDAVKTGMLGTIGVIEAVATVLAELDPSMCIPIVVDPVMRAESGADLLDADAVATLTAKLLPLARVTTPNLYEAQLLARSDSDDARVLARSIFNAYGCAVIVTGGHGPIAADILCDEMGLHEIPGLRLPISTTHGAGCTYAATLATLLGGGVPLLDAALQAKRVATGAVRGGRHYGTGAGPVDVSRWQG